MPSITPTLALSILDTITSKVDEGSAGDAVLRIYSAGTTPPTNVNDALTDQVLLIEFVLPNPAFNAATDADPTYVEAIAAAIANIPAAATGDAAFARVFNRDGEALWQSSVGETGGTEEVLLSSKSVTKDVETTVINANARYPKDA
ncbi:hypothetical protein HNR26_002353 [Rhizobium rosettiformans]|uniref:Uncharacterized protein n=2 Tax=Rhizobium rosettiformans TaxID=1368430 RepID=A0A4S8PZ39_9HYPH|nr:hypothetical protein [Rhizobium rosettiformans]MBB5276301.1 hypothetical protein [Rhizobium rosettiformans]THV36930.1 hypothetical protein FAA86_10620 [Rhizobium rosettiformans W3]